MQENGSVTLALLGFLTRPFDVHVGLQTTLHAPAEYCCRGRDRLPAEMQRGSWDDGSLSKELSVRAQSRSESPVESVAAGSPRNPISESKMGLARRLGG